MPCLVPGVDKAMMNKNKTYLPRVRHSPGPSMHLFQPRDSPMKQGFL